MRRFTPLLLAVAVLCQMTSAPAFAAGPADVVQRDALVYVECGRDAAQGLLAAAALPPAAGMVMPQAGDPFAYVDTMLRVPAGTAAQAAPHLEGVAFATVGDEALFILAFDQEAWPERLLQGMKRGPDGLAELGPPDACGTARGSLLVFGARDACAGIPPNPGAALASRPAYARAKAKGGAALAFAAIPQVLDVVLGSMPRSNRAAFSSFAWLSGLDKADYLIASAGPGPKAKVILHFEDEGALLLRVLPQASIQAAAEAPGDVALALALNWGDAGILLGHVRDLVTQMGALEGAREAGDPFAQVEIALGVTLDELAATLGSGAVLCLAAGPGTDMIGRQDWTAVLPLRDAQGFRAILDRACQSTMGAPLPSVERQGESLLRLPMAPAFLKITDDLLVISGSPQNLLRYLDWRKAAGRDTLLDQVGEGPLAAVLRADLGRLLTSYPSSSSGTKLVLSLAREGHDLILGLGTEDLDSRQLYREYMKLYSGIMAGMLMPAVARARTEAQRASGRANLHNIGLGLAMYEQDHGRYPESLGELADGGYLSDARLLIDPSDPAPRLLADGRRTSYEFVGPLPAGVPPDTIIVCTRRGVHPEGRNVLHVDIAVSWLNEWQMGQPGRPRWSLRASYDAVVEAYGDALSPERDAQLRKFYEITD